MASRVMMRNSIRNNKRVNKFDNFFQQKNIRIIFDTDPLSDTDNQKISLESSDIPL